MMSRPNKQGMSAGMQPGSIVLDDLPQFARLS
jgi:hypothetical protein